MKIYPPDDDDFLLGLLFLICLILGLCLTVNTVNYNQARKAYCGKVFNSNVAKYQDCMKKDLNYMIRGN